MRRGSAIIRAGLTRRLLGITLARGFNHHVLTKAEIQQVHSLQQKKYRESEGLFVVEGPKVIGELLAADFLFTRIYALSAWADSAPASALPLTIVTEREMERLSHYPTPSTVLALGNIVRHDLDVTSLRTGLTLALDGLQDPGNVGTLLRIADWFGFARVLCSADCADVFSQKAINASMGSFARVRTHVVSLPEVLANVGIPVFGCDLIGQPLNEFSPPKEGVIVIGREGSGLSTEVKRVVTTMLTIPRFGLAESLNAAVAAGIVCHHFRQRG